MKMMKVMMMNKEEEEEEEEEDDDDDDDGAACAGHGAALLGATCLHLRAQSLGLLFFVCCSRPHAC